MSPTGFLTYTENLRKAKSFDSDQPGGLSRLIWFDNFTDTSNALFTEKWLINSTMVGAQVHNQCRNSGEVANFVSYRGLKYHPRLVDKKLKFVSVGVHSNQGDAIKKLTAEG